MSKKMLVKNALRSNILATKPLVYFPLNETEGTAAINYGTLGTGSNGSYINGVSLAQVNAPGGGKSPTFDGTNDYTNIYTTDLAGVFNGQLGSIAGWFKVTDDNVWTDKSSDVILSLGADANNFIHIYKQSGNANLISFRYKAGGTEKVFYVVLAGTGWYFFTLTWDKSADQLKLYINNIQWADTIGLLGTWTGTLASNGCNLGEYAPPSGVSWKGSIAHVAVWNKVLSGTEMTDIYNKGSSIITLPVQTGEAAVLFTFDDSVENVYTNAFPLFTAAGMKFTAYVLTSSFNVANHQTMYAAGMDVAIHAHNHTSFSNLTQEEIETELSTAKGILDAAGMTRASSHVAYPFGASGGSTLAAMAAQGMVTGRSVSAGYMDYVHVKDHFGLYGLPSYEVNANVSLNFLKSVIDEALRYNKVICFYDHQVEGATITKYENILNYMQTIGMPTLTITEWYARYAAKYP